MMDKKGGVTLTGLIVGFMAFLIYALAVLPILDPVLDIAVPQLTGMTKWVVQLFPAAFLVTIIFYMFKDNETY